MNKKINIAIAGFGNIGSYFYKCLEKNKSVINMKTGKIPAVKYISAKNINKKRKIKIPKSKWVKNPIHLTVKKDVDVIIVSSIHFGKTNDKPYINLNDNEFI